MFISKMFQITRTNIEQIFMERQSRLWHVSVTLGFVKGTNGTEPLRGDTSQSPNEQYLSILQKLISETIKI